MSDHETGIVKWFDNTKGFGFIVRDNGGKDLFVHQTAILSDGFRSLEEGDNVEFVVVKSDKGPQAQEVSKI